MREVKKIEEFNTKILFQPENPAFRGSWHKSRKNVPQINKLFLYNDVSRAYKILVLEPELGVI